MNTTPEQIIDLTKAHIDAHQDLLDFSSSLDTRVAAKEQEVDEFLSNAHTGPYFIVRGNGDWWYPTPGQWTELTGSIMNWLVNSQKENVFDTSSGQFTAPRDGLYHFFSQSYVHNDNHAANGYIHWQLAVDGETKWNAGSTPYNIFAYGSIAGHVDGISTAATIYLSQGQTVSLKPFKASGASNTRIQRSHTYFSGFLIGR